MIGGDRCAGGHSSKFELTMADTDREQIVYQAILAERAGRYEGSYNACYFSKVPQIIELQIAYL